MHLSEVLRCLFDRRYFFTVWKMPPPQKPIKLGSKVGFDDTLPLSFSFEPFCLCLSTILVAFYQIISFSHLCLPLFLPLSLSLSCIFDIFFHFSIMLWYLWLPNLFYLSLSSTYWLYLCRCVFVNLFTTLSAFFTLSLHGTKSLSVSFSLSKELSSLFLPHFLSLQHFSFLWYLYLSFSSIPSLF